MRGSKGSSFSRAKRILWDISGAFGDIGVLFPIAVALIVKNGFNPTALFLMAGLFYIASSYHFKITMPVQPLKAMSAIAIATGLGYEVINAAGITMGVLLLIISVTGVSVRLGNIFPLSVIRGIQLGLGLILVKTSWSLIHPDFSVAVVAGVILIASLLVVKSIPPLIPLLLLTMLISLKSMELTSFGPLALTPRLPEPHNIWTGFTMLVLPQIALTFGNAIVATEATGKLLYGKRAEALTMKSIPMSMGIANIISGILGGAPMCHGSGGLTAHSKFGATTERSGYMIGLLLIGLAILFGGSSVAVISAFPKGILGILLCYVGIEHSLFIRDILRDRVALLVAVTTAVLGFITGNLTIGFLTGIGIHYAFKGLLVTFKHPVKN
jgi:PPE-repeat protein